VIPVQGVAGRFRDSQHGYTGRGTASPIVGRISWPSCWGTLVAPFEGSEQSSLGGLLGLARGWVGASIQGWQHQQRSMTFEMDSAQ
jgi:hypothetical protein